MFLVFLGGVSDIMLLKGFEFCKMLNKWELLFFFGTERLGISEC